MFFSPGNRVINPQNTEVTELKTKTNMSKLIQLREGL